MLQVYSPVEKPLNRGLLSTERTGDTRELNSGLETSLNAAYLQGTGLTPGCKGIRHPLALTGIKPDARRFDVSQANAAFTA